MLRSVLAGEPLVYALSSHSLPPRSKWSDSASVTCSFIPAYQTLTQQQLQDQVLKISRAQATRGQQSIPLVPTASGGLGTGSSDKGSSEAGETEQQEEKRGATSAGTAAVKQHGRGNDEHSQRQGESSDEELQILERKARSCSSETSTMGTSSENATATELIFRLERQGDGWAEEILPRFTVVKRPLASSKPPPQGDCPLLWEKGSPEQLLRDRCDVPEDEIDDLLTTATAWRVTPAGRPLIDRRRRRRVAKNVEAVADYLERLGVPPGRSGVGKVLRQLPQLMLCKPSSTDRWDRRATELAAYAFHTGSCNVSEDDKEHFELAAWVKRQRVLWQQGNLTEDRIKLLSTLGFEPGVETAITDEWEYRFDQLVEWLLLLGVNKPNGAAESLWLGLDWGQRGGLQGRECCLWVQLQRELRRQHLLPAEAVKRLDNLKFQWELQGERPQEVRWVRQLGRLAFEIERSRKLSDVDQNSAAYRERQRQAFPRDKQPDLAPKPDASILLGQEEDSRAAENVWMQQEVFARRRALQAVQLGPGLSYWLAKQQWRWRRGRLPQEQTLLLRLQGVDFDLYDLDQWRKEAHAAAAFLLDSHLSADLPRPRKNRRRSTPGHSNGLMQSARGASGVRAKAVLGARLRVERWVLTQQALYAERRLSMPQIRYLALLEISWLLNRHSLRPENLLWGRGLPRHIAESHHEGPPDAELRVQQLRALRTLGWLGNEQEAEMRTAGVDPKPRRSREDRKWDERLTELLAYRREFGDCRVPASGWDTAPELRPWLVEQQKQWRQERLPAKRSTQLAALGVERRPN